MRLYIAGPMTGIPEFNYPAFNHVADQLRDAGYSVLNPAETDPADHGHHRDDVDWAWYMRQALKQVADAQGIALLPGWRKSKGARLEYIVASHLDLPRLTVNEWIAYRDEIAAERKS